MKPEFIMVFIIQHHAFIKITSKESDLRQTQGQNSHITVHDKSKNLRGDIISGIVSLVPTKIRKYKRLVKPVLM